VRTTTFLGILAISLIGLGCGGDSGDEIAASDLPKAAFLEKADATCLAAYNRTKAGFEDFVSDKEKPLSNLEEMREFTGTVTVPAKRRLVRELQAMGAPEGDGDQVEAIIGALEEGIEHAEEDPRTAVTSTFGVFSEATRLAEEYGLVNCR